MVVEHKRMLENERSRIARDMHDQLGAQLTQISLLTELARQEQSSNVKSTSHLSRITQATGELIHKMDQVVWAVNPLKDNLEELVGYCTDYAEHFFESSSISCRVHIPDDLPEFRISSRVRYQFFLVLGEALNNIVKHAEASEVRLSWELSQVSLTLNISDNGKGFKHEDTAKGRNGLLNMDERMKSIGGTLILTSELNRGTMVQLSILQSEFQ